MAKKSWSTLLAEEKQRRAGNTQPVQTSAPSSSQNKPKKSWSTLVAEEKERRTNTARSGMQEWANTSNKVLSEIQKYYSEYHDDEDKWYDSYDQSLSTLLSSADQYRREYAGDADVVASIDQIADTLTKTKTYIKEANKRNKQWKGTESYTKTMNRLAEVDKINGLYGMSTADIDKAKGESGSEIAYTTMDGQNITWDALYRRKKKEEDYAVFSKRADWAENSTYKSTVPDENADYNDFSQPTVDWDYEEMNNPEAFSHLRGGSTYRSEHMTKEEMEMFNYIYHTQGREAAFDWQRSLAEDLETLRVQDITAKTKEFASKNPLYGAAAWAGARLTSPLAGAEYVGDLVDNLFVPEKSMRNTAAARNAAVDSTITEQIDWKLGNWDAFDFGYGTVTSAVDSALASLLPGGEAVLGLSAAAAATNAALDRGMDERGAIKAGISAGVFESVFEHISIGQFRNLQMIDPKSAKDFVFNTIKSMGVNASEEAATEIANSVYDIYVNGEFSDYETSIRMMVQNGMTPEEARAEAKKALGKQIAEAAASGALMGLGFGVTGSAIGYNSGLKQTGKETRSADGFELQELADESLQLNPDNKLAQRILDKGKASDRQIGKLVRANEDARHAADVENTRQAVTARLTALKATENVEAVADAVTKYVTGEKLTKAEQELIRRNRVAPQVAQEIREQKRAEEYMHIVEAAQIDAGATENTDGKLAAEVQNIAQAGGEAAETATIAESATVEAADVNERKTLLRAGDAFEEVELDETHPISAINNGKMVLRLADGRNVAAEDISHVSEDIANVYSVVESLAADAQTANAMASGYKADMKSNSYIMGLQLSHMYGKNNISMKELVDGSPSAAKLPTAVREAAYHAGRIANTAAVSAAQQEKSKGAVKGMIGKGSVQFTTGNGNTEDLRGYIKRSGIKLNRQQQAGIVEMEMMAEAVGANFFVYESYVKGDGGRYYIDEHGKESKAPNGMYYKDGRIYIDLNAGNAGKGTMLYTTGHELGHHIKEWAPEKFDALAKFLVEKYGEKGVSVESLVARQIEKAERSNRDIDFDEALEEVVADAMESILVDGKVMQMVADLQQQDKALGDKVREWFKNLLAKLKAIASAYKKFTPDSLEGQLVAEMDKSVIQQLHQMYAEGLVEAGENLSAARIGVEIDNETESVSPAVAMMSERTWTESDYVQQREEAAKEISKAIGVSEKKAKDYIDSVNSIAKMIAEDRVRLDYFSSPGRSSFVSNVEYGGSFDFSTLCKKRRLLTGTFTAIQKALPNTALTANEILDIRNRMKDAGLEVSCGLCYVEGSRANMGQFAKEFLKLYKQYYPDAWQPNMADVNTPDGIEWVRINHPECYEQYEYFWNHYGTLQQGDKNLFASQQKPKLYQLHTEYKGEILSKFNDDENVEEKNLNGGIRLQSFSDFEIVHLIDTMQIIMDMSRVGLAGQAYTKVPDFAWALGDTGLKINLSLIAKGVDGNGNLIFDDVEGMPIADAMKLRDRYSENVGTILVAFNDEQLKAAMADERVDFIIPFHRSQWKKSQYGAMGLPAKTKDYTYMQNEKFIKPQYHEYRGRMVKDKATNYMPNEYWDFSKSGKENAEAYLEMCARNNKRPKFYKLLQNNGDGSYSLKADGSTDGYWKLLIDFKMYDNAGNGSPQRAVRPDFNMVEADYTGGHSNFPVAQGIVDEFVSEYKDSHKGAKYSIRDDVDITADKYYPKTQREQSAFNREYINKTNGLKPGQKRDIIIYTANNVYYVNATGEYGDNPFTGYIREKISLDGYSDAEERDEFKNGTYEPTEEDYLAHETARSNRRRDGYRVKSLRERAEEEGFSHLLADENEEDSGGSSRHGIQNSKMKFSDRDGESVSNRALLANALESITQNESEKQRLQEYRGVIDSLNEQEQKLQELNAEIKQLSFAEGKRDTERLEKLRTEAKKTVNRINTLDGKLLRLEAAKPLQDVLKREKAKAYKRAEEKGKKAVKAMHDKMIESREKAEMKARIRKKVKTLDDLLYNGNKHRNVKQDMRELASTTLMTVDTFLMTDEEARTMLLEYESEIVTLQEELAQYDADSKQYKKLQSRIRYRKARVRALRDRADRRSEGIPIEEVTTHLSNAYRGILSSEEPYIRDAYDQNVQGHIDALGAKLKDTMLDDMSVDQIKQLSNIVTMILTTIRDANKAFVASRSVDEIAESLISELETRKMPKTKVAAVARNLSNNVGWDYEKLYYALQRVGSDTLTELFTNLANSEDIVMADAREAAEARDNIVKKYGYNDWNTDQKINKTFIDSTGKEFELTLGELMSLYAYSRRKDAWNHIEYGGFVFSKTALTDIDPVTAYKLTKDQCETITNTLKKEQKKFVEEMQTFLSDTMGAKGNEVSMQLYGIEMFGEKNYFPVHVAGQFMARAQESQAKAEAGFSSMTNAGFTQALNKNAKAPFVIESFMDVWADHVNEMSRYHGAVPALEDIRKVMNRSSYSDAYADSVSVKAILENKCGKEAVKYFDELYKEANSGAITDKLQKSAQKWISKFRKNSVAYSASVLIQQPASIVRAYAMLPMKYFRGKGVLTLPAGVGQAIFNRSVYKTAYAEMMKYAPGVTLSKEIGGFDTASGNSIRSYLLDTGKSFKQKIKTETDIKGRTRTAMGLIEDNPIANLPNVADKIAWIEIWTACKRETADKHGDMKTNSDEFMQLAGKRFTEIIRATQVYDSMFSKSPLLKSKNVFVQSVVSFMNEPNTTVNMIENAIRTAAKGNGKAARTITAVAGSIVLTGVLKSLVYALRDDDEEKNFIEKYMAELTSSLISDFTVFNYIPYARDVWSMAQGFDVERSDMAIIADAINSIKELGALKLKDTDEMSEDELIEFDKKVIQAHMSLLDSVCAVFGIPEKNIRREIKAILNLAKSIYKRSGGEASWASIEDAVLEGVKSASPSLSGTNDESRGDRLYSAIVEGDEVYAERLKSAYKDESAVNNAVQKALRENDPRIREAAEELGEEDFESALDIIDEMIAEGNFTENDINAAVDAEYTKLFPEEKEESKEKAKTTMNAERYVTAIINGKSSEIAAVKDEIIETAVKNGKTEEEAEESLISSAKTELKKRYVTSEITKQQTVSLLAKHTGMSSKDVDSLVNKWTMTVVLGMDYDSIQDEFLAGNITEAKAVEWRVRYGGESKKDAAATVSKWKCEKDTGIPYDNLREKFVAGNITVKEAVNAMVKYGGMKQREAEETATEWKAEKETGIAYDNIKESFLEGELTETETTDMYKNYGGKSQSDAEDAVASLKFEKDYGFNYNDKREMYIDGEISETTLRKALTEYGEKTAEDADNIIRAYDWMKQNPEYDLSESYAVAYTKPLEEYGGYSVADTGLDPDTFVSYKKQAAECEGVDSNGDGKADKNSKKRQVLALIDSLPISNNQKDALYFASGNWKASRLYEAPWR